MSSYFPWSKSDVKRSMSVCAISSSFLSTFVPRFGAIPLVGRISSAKYMASSTITPVAHAQAAELLLLVEHVLDDRREARLLHRAQQEEIDLLRPVRRPEVVAPLEDDRVDLVALHEVEDLDRAVALLLGRLEVLVLEVHELAVGDLVRLDDLVGRHLLALLLADLLVADPRAVLLVDEMELEVVLVDRAVHPHGSIDEAEGDASGPDRSWHGVRVPVRTGAETACYRPGGD